MRAVIFTILTFIHLPLIAGTAQYKGAEHFEIDFDAGWQAAKSNDPAVILRLENKNNYIEFAKLEDELSDYYLKAKVKEQMETFKNKGESFSDVKSATIHSVSNAYYTSSSEKIVGFFTYNGVSYAFMSKGVSESSFKDVMYFFRKPGEKVEKPKPAPKKKKKKEIEEKDESSVQYFMVNESTQITDSPIVSTATLPEESTAQIMAQIEPPTQVQQPPEQNIEKQLLSFIAYINEKSQSEKAILDRKPLNKFVGLSFIVIIAVSQLMFSAKYSKIPNPKMKPYPQDVPPDFFFPFIITRVNTAKETMFHIMTRQKQILSGYFNHEYRPWTSIALYGLLYFHLLWSLSGFINENLFSAAMMSLPFGKYIAAAPETFFLIILVIGLAKKSKNEKKLLIQDAQTNPVTSISEDKKCYAIMKDGKGKEVAQLHFRGTRFDRKWHFVDVDNQIVFTIVDEHPEIFKAVKFFGNFFGSLRSRYSIMVDGKRAGFLFIDLNSKDGFQVHLEYDFGRLANPAHIMTALLYIAAREREKSFLSI